MNTTDISVLGILKTNFNAEDYPLSLDWIEDEISKGTYETINFTIIKTFKAKDIFDLTHLRLQWNIPVNTSVSPNHLIDQVDVILIKQGSDRAFYNVIARAQHSVGTTDFLIAVDPVTTTQLHNLSFTATLVQGHELYDDTYLANVIPEPIMLLDEKVTILDHVDLTEIPANATQYKFSNRRSLYNVTPLLVSSVDLNKMGGTVQKATVYTATDNPNDFVAVPQIFPISKSDSTTVSIKMPDDTFDLSLVGSRIYNTTALLDSETGNRGLAAVRQLQLENNLQGSYQVPSCFLQQTPALYYKQLTSNYISLITNFPLVNINIPPTDPDFSKVRNMKSFYFGISYSLQNVATGSSCSVSLYDIYESSITYVRDLPVVSYKSNISQLFTNSNYFLALNAYALLTQDGCACLRFAQFKYTDPIKPGNKGSYLAGQVTSNPWALYSLSLEGSSNMLSILSQNAGIQNRAQIVSGQLKGDQGYQAEKFTNETSNWDYLSGTSADLIAINDADVALFEAQQTLAEKNANRALQTAQYNPGLAGSMLANAMAGNKGGILENVVEGFQDFGNQVDSIFNQFGRNIVGALTGNPDKEQKIYKGKRATTIEAAQDQVDYLTHYKTAYSDKAQAMLDANIRDLDEQVRFGKTNSDISNRQTNAALQAQIDLNAQQAKQSVYEATLALRTGAYSLAFQPATALNNLTNTLFRVSYSAPTKRDVLFNIDIIFQKYGYHHNKVVYYNDTPRSTLQQAWDWRGRQKWVYGKLYCDILDVVSSYKKPFPNAFKNDIRVRLANGIRVWSVPKVSGIYYEDNPIVTPTISPLDPHLPPGSAQGGSSGVTSGDSSIIDTRISSTIFSKSGAINKGSNSITFPNVSELTTTDKFILMLGGNVPSENDDFIYGVDSPLVKLQSGFNSMQTDGSFTRTEIYYGTIPALIRPIEVNSNSYCGYALFVLRDFTDPVLYREDAYETNAIVIKGFAKNTVSFILNSTTGSPLFTGDGASIKKIYNIGTGLQAVCVQSTGITGGYYLSSSAFGYYGMLNVSPKGSLVVFS